MAAAAAAAAANQPEAVNFRQLDPKIWRACAGSSVHIPIVGSKVYYFPQGHVEQSAYPPSLSSAILTMPIIPCRIADVQLLADHLTDEAFAKVLLHPLTDRNSGAAVHQPVGLPAPQFGFGDGVEEGDRVTSFAKVLTSSDANNGGGFSVPRYCADSIFPPLNFQADPPVQTLSITDVHGTVWNFRHIYRGTPRRHLLTTGWSKFVNGKKLIAGDSVVFTKNSRGEMFVGIRRAVRSSGASDSTRWTGQIGGEGYTMKENRLVGGKEVFSRKSIGKVPPESVVNATELAAQLKPFEVKYYPRVGWSEFIVKAETVEESMKVYWSSGIRVKMALETEDSSRMTWYQGSVSAISVPDHGPWKGSPWRMLQVTWDETETLQNSKRVSPWEVEFATPNTPIEAPLHPAKKLRCPQKSGFLTGEEQLYSPMMRFGNSTMEQFDQSLLDYNSFPAGMQGARQSLLCESRLSNSNPLTRADNSLSKLNVVPELPMVSTELLIGSSYSDDLSPDSQGSVLSFATEAAGNQCCNTTKVGTNTFQLFGQIIHINRPVENGLDGGVCTNHDGNIGLDGGVCANLGGNIGLDGGVCPNCGDNNGLDGGVCPNCGDNNGLDGGVCPNCGGNNLLDGGVCTSHGGNNPNHSS